MVKKKKKAKKGKKKTKKKAKKKVAKKKKKGSKKKGSRKAFGGYTISFNNCDDSLEYVFGKGHIAPSQMTKKLWNYVKRKRLAKR